MYYKTYYYQNLDPVRYCAYVNKNDELGPFGEYKCLNARGMEAAHIIWWILLKPISDYRIPPVSNDGIFIENHVTWAAGPERDRGRPAIDGYLGYEECITLNSLWPNPLLIHHCYSVCLITLVASRNSRTTLPQQFSHGTGVCWWHRLVYRPTVDCFKRMQDKVVWSYMGQIIFNHHAEFSDNG